MGKKLIKKSLIITVFNEENTITELLRSINTQTVKPDEIIIVDGGSSDSTIDKIKSFKSELKNNNSTFKIIVKKGNRSVGRNTAIENASHEIILCTDAGCTLDKNWVKNMVKPFYDEEADIVAGYYDSKPKNTFEKSLVPYVLVMKDRLDPDNFLPATRSMAFKKKVWEKAGKFDEKLSNNEDYAFAKMLKKINARIVFTENAIVWWKPRENLSQAFNMFYRFALGDIEAGILRLKVALIILRYFAGLILFSISLITGSIHLLILTILLLIFYVIWAIAKNYKYVKSIMSFIYLPSLQFLSDFAILIGVMSGLLKRVGIKEIKI